MQLDQLKQYLWMKIRAHQANGGVVRNLKTASLLDKDCGCYSGSTRCLIGVAAELEDIPTNLVREKLAEYLNLTLEQVNALEKGFEDWRLTELSTMEFFQVGREIAIQLTKEEMEES